MTLKEERLRRRYRSDFLEGIQRGRGEGEGWEARRGWRDDSCFVLGFPFKKKIESGIEKFKDVCIALEAVSRKTTRSNVVVRRRKRREDSLTFLFFARKREKRNRGIQLRQRAGWVM